MQIKIIYFFSQLFIKYLFDDELSNWFLSRITLSAIRNANIQCLYVHSTFTLISWVEWHSVSKMAYKLKQWIKKNIFNPFKTTSFFYRNVPFNSNISHCLYRNILTKSRVIQGLFSVSYAYHRYTLVLRLINRKGKEVISTKENKIIRNVEAKKWATFCLIHLVWFMNVQEAASKLCYTFSIDWFAKLS